MNADTVTLGTAPTPVEPGIEEDARPRASADPEPRFESFAARLLAPEDGAGTLLEEGRRLAIGIGMSALFGGALGLRIGGGAIVGHALGVAGGLMAVAGVAAPAFAIVLALANAPVDASALGRSTATAVAKAGLVLGGLAPAAALYVVTVEDAITVSIVGFGGLILAGVIGARSFAHDLAEPLRTATARTQIWMTLAMPAFLLFAGTLALRVWWLALPVLTAVARGAR